MFRYLGTYMDVKEMISCTTKLFSYLLPFKVTWLQDKNKVSTSRSQLLTCSSYELRVVALSALVQFEGCAPREHKRHT